MSGRKTAIFFVMLIMLHWTSLIAEARFWETLEVPVEDYSSITVDPLHYIHMSSYTGGTLYYTTNRSGDWIKEIVDTNQIIMNPPTQNIHVDPQGAVHIIYSTGPIRALPSTGYITEIRHAVKQNETWTVTGLYSMRTATASDYVLSSTMDDNGKLHLAYAIKGGSLYYATNASGVWTAAPEPIPGTWSGILDISLIADKAGLIHIAYTTTYEKTPLLWYVSNKTGEWVAEMRELGWSQSMALDEQGNIHRAYVALYWIKFGLFYDGTRILPSVDHPWLKPGLVADPSGGAHVICQGTYITNRSGSWSTDTLEVGETNAIGLDGVSTAYIAYTGHLKRSRDGCPMTVTPLETSFTPDGGEGTIEVTALADCTWTASSGSSWLHISQGSLAQGNGTVTYSVDPNPFEPFRKGTLTVAGETVIVNQGACGYTLSPISWSFGAAGATGLINVNTYGVCSWTATPSASWIHIESGASGTGSGNVLFSVDPKPTAFSRDGIITVAGKVFSVHQEGLPCGYSLSNTEAPYLAAGGQGSVDLAVSPGCPWTAQTDATWIGIIAGASGDGPGTVGYTVFANSAGSPRQATITIGGRAFTVAQAGTACAYYLGSTSAAFGPWGGIGTVEVTASSGCPWPAASNVPWISVGQGAIEGGNATLYYNVEPNAGTVPRQGTLTIAGDTFTVQQGFGGAIAKYPSGHILFETLEAGNREICISNADGTGFRTLTSHQAADTQPVLSPDGATIAFVSNRDGANQIFTMSASGRNPANITKAPGTENGHPGWSPDGKRIAFSTNRGGNAEIYTMNPDGSDPVNLTNHPAADFQPAWSPDGARIAFVSNRSGNNEIFVMDANGGNQQRLTVTSASNFHPAWSPDSSRIAFASDRNGPIDIYIMNANGTGTIRFTGGGATNYHPSWSPEGSFLAFSSNRSAGKYQVYAVPFGGGTLVNVSHNLLDNFSPTWAASRKGDLNAPWLFNLLE